MQSITVSAPGKLHLSGEHAVVYGKPAVLVATDRRLSVTLGNEKNKRFPELNALNSGNLISVRKTDKYIDYICKIFENKHKLKINPSTSLREYGLQLSIKSDIPQGRGMGSSAALAVALIAVLTKWYKKPWDLIKINELAFQAEKYQHGNPSGGDNSIVTFGGILWYRREFDFLKTFWALPFKFPQKLSKVVLIDTGRSESTGEMVKMVSMRFEVVFQQIEDTTKQMVLAIKLGDEKLFTDSFKNNEFLLEKIGVVSKSVKKLIREIEKNEGAAKISGAGGVKNGSGIVIGYHKNPKILISLAQKYNYPYFQVKLGGEGVRVEKEIY